MSVNPFSHSVEPLGPRASFLLKLTGSVDIKTSGELERIGLGLIQQGDERLVLDLADVDYINSQGLGAILFLQRTLDPRGGGVVIACVSGQIRATFEMTGFNQAVPMYNSLEEALSRDRLFTGRS